MDVLNDTKRGTLNRTFGSTGAAATEAIYRAIPSGRLDNEPSERSGGTTLPQRDCAVPKLGSQSVGMSPIGLENPISIRPWMLLHKGNFLRKIQIQPGDAVAMREHFFKRQ